MNNRPVDVGGGSLATDRFWSKVDQSGDCWEWTAAANRQGYGKFKARSYVLVPAHRHSWELANGPIPAGMYVCHRCDNPRCVRPDHLFLGTHQDNVTDMMAKGRHRYERGIVAAHTALRSQGRVATVKTHCINGHEYTPENTYVYRDVKRARAHRACRACHTNRERLRRGRTA